MKAEEIKRVLDNIGYILDNEPESSGYITIKTNFDGSFLVDFSEIINTPDENCLFINNSLHPYYLDYSDIQDIK